MLYQIYRRRITSMWRRRAKSVDQIHCVLRAIHHNTANIFYITLCNKATCMSAYILHILLHIIIGSTVRLVMEKKPFLTDNVKEYRDLSVSRYFAEAASPMLRRRRSRVVVLSCGASLHETRVNLKYIHLCSPSRW